MENFIVNVALPATIVVVLIAAALFVVSLLVGIFQNIKGSAKLLIGLAVILLTYFISYATASDFNPTSIPMTAGAVKSVVAGINTMVTMVILAVVSWMGMAIYNAVK